MKILNFTMNPLLIISVLAAGLVSGCTRAKQEDKETTQIEDEATLPATGNVPDTADTIAADQQQVTKESFGQQMTEKLNTFDSRIDTIENRLEEKGQDVQTAFSAQLEKLKGNRQAAAEQLNNFKAASDEAWTDMREGVAQAIFELETAVNEAERWLEAH